MYIILTLTRGDDSGLLPFDVLSCWILFNLETSSGVVASEKKNFYFMM